MSFRTVTGNLGVAVAQAGTFDVTYPTDTSAADFKLGVAHKLVVIGAEFSAPEDITLSFGASAVTVTYNGATTLPASAAYVLQLDEQGGTAAVEIEGVQAYDPVTLGSLDLGAPGAADADGILASAAVLTATGTATVLTGALVADGVAVMNARTGRNVVAAWTGAAVLTVNGTDMYGNAMTESSASGTSFAGKKAFKEVTSFSVSADVTACTIGSGDVIGIPVYTPNATMVLAQSQDGAAAVAGTTVAGLARATKPTATNADVRGTYDPNAACDGSKVFTLLVAMADPTDIGAEQYSA